MDGWIQGQKEGGTETQKYGSKNSTFDKGDIVGIIQPLLRASLLKIFFKKTKHE
jgi:hypothetical protein